MAHSSRKGVVVTGTDTGVGKTWVAVRLIRALRRRGHAVCPLKPVESGCLEVDGGLLAQDAEALREAAGLERLEAVVRFKLRAPLAPVLAAEQEGVPTALQDLLEFCRRQDGVRIIEGAGGWRSPLVRDGDLRDLATALELPVLVVAEDRLGAINHALLTCEAVKQTPHCRLAGVVLNRRQPEAGMYGNFQMLQRRLRRIPVWLTGPDQWLSESEERAVLRTFAPPSPDA